MRILLALLSVVALALAALAVDAARVLTRPLQLPGDVVFTIEEGQPFAAVAQRLAAQGWLAPAPRGVLYLRVYARLSGTERQLKAGEYRLLDGMTPLRALDLFVSGKGVLYQLTLVEGWTFRQALDAVHAHPQLQQTLAPGDAAAVMAALGRADQKPEGRLFPDTYHFARGTTDVAFLRRAADTMDRVLAAEWDARAEDLPYATPEEALVMASIVEKETGAPHERTQIAGVFVRRLQRGMRLQTDPTVIYGLGEAFDGNLRKRDLIADGEYNTYTRTGLPPSPICLPGRASIRAALHPDGGSALFFVSRGDGTHEFSATLEQHEAAVRRYQLKR